MNIFNLDEQIIDLMRVSTINNVKKPTQNPLNILWMLEHYDKEIDNEKDRIKKDEYFNKLAKVKLNNSTTRKIHLSTIMASIVLDEDMLIKRLEFLVKQGGSLKNKGILFLQYKSLNLFKKAVELGLDINEKIDDIFGGISLLNKALSMKSGKIVQYLWSLEGLNKNIIDGNNNNIAHLIVRSKSHYLLEDIYNEYPHYFLELNSKNENTIDLMTKWKDDSSVKGKNKLIMEKILLSLFQKCHENPLLMNEACYKNISNHEIINNLYISSRKEYLDKILNNNNIKTCYYKNKI